MWGYHVIAWFFFYDKMFYDDMHEHVVMTIMLYDHDDMKELACGLFV
jgi:hypothetical protein